MRSLGADDAAVLLAYACRVVIVPGYGLAVAQAQHVARELADLLESRRSTCATRSTRSRDACRGT